jgi:DNA polymerase I-like protein with 3'-5' exonuclease and polymerase domains
MNYRDTLLEHYLAIDENNGASGLKMLATKYTDFGGYEAPLEEFFTKNAIKGDEESRDYSKVPLSLLLEYNAKDTFVTKLISIVTWNALIAEGMEILYKTIVLPSIRLVIDMKRVGFKVDHDLLEKLDTEYRDQLLKLETELQSNEAVRRACFLWHEKKVQACIVKSKKRKDVDLHALFSSKIELPKFNVRSPEAMKILLYEILSCPISKMTDTGQPSTDGAVLDEILRVRGFPVIQTIKEIRAISKMQSMYSKDAVLGWHSPDGLVHTNFFLHSTVTGRMSSGKPVNFQNFPRTGSAKKLIVSRFVQSIELPNTNQPMSIHGQILKGDYSQIELRILAQYSQDQNMLKAFYDELDIHIEATLGILDMSLDEYLALDKKKAKELRQIGKTYNFALVYGQGDETTAQTLSNVLQRPVEISEAAEKKEKYMKRFSGVAAWIKRTEYEATKNGYVTTMFGRKRRLPILKTVDADFAKQKEALRQAVNMRVQGTAADLLTRAACKLADKMRELKMQSLVIGTVHDEIVVDVHPAETTNIVPLVKQIMLDSPSIITVPLDVEVKMGKNWMDAENVG